MRIFFSNENDEQIVRASGEVASDKASLKAIRRIDDEAKDSGKVSFDSFVNMLNQTNAMNSIECSDEAFKFFDKAGKGKITPEDLVNGFTALGNKLTLADAKDIVNIIGGGDSINLDEFKEIAQVDSMMVV